MQLTHLAIKILAGSLFATAAQAHPHVFIDARAGFVLDEAGRLSAVQVTWTYDAFTSLTLMDMLDLDRDGDGALDAADRARLVEAQTIWPDDFEGDTYLEQNGASVALTRPIDGASWMTDAEISVSFELPLAAPIAVEGDVVLRLYDPTYYFAYATVDLQDIPEGCAAELVPFQADNASAALQAQLALLSREETPDDQNVGRRFADQVWLTCG